MVLRVLLVLFQNDSNMIYYKSGGRQGISSTSKRPIRRWDLAAVRQ